MSTIILNPFEIFGGIPRNGLVAEYLFSNNVLDTSGNGYNGVHNNVTFGNDRKGNPNSAGIFNGTNAFVDIDAALAGLSTTTKGTWSTWIKPVDATPTIGCSIINFSNTSALERLGLFVQTTGTLIAVCQKNGVIQWILETDNPVFSDGIWANPLIIHDAAEASLYFNGLKPAQTFSGSTIDKTVWFNDLTGIDNGRIGSIKFNNNPDSNFLNGSNDDNRLYNRDLSQAEITILANE